MRAERLGITLLHWVVEWQERGVPHMHCAIFFPDTIPQVEMGEALIVAWLTISEQRFGASMYGQTWDAIEGPLGWLQYLSKHAARGVRHYQRQGKPEGWEKTGRLWGHNRGWPEVEPWVLDASWGAYWVLRRWVRGWRLSNARTELLRADTPEKQRAARARIRSARRMLRCPDEKISRGRGISEWISLEHLAQFVDEMRVQGLEVETRDLIPVFDAD